MTDSHHHHEHPQDATGKKLLLTLAINIIIPVIQLIGGFYANSMALISDASHNFSDSISLFIAYLANRMSRKEATVTHTFGYHRAEIIAAVANVGLLAGVALFIIYEAFKRLLQPQAVAGFWVMTIAAVGIIGNGFSAWLLYKDSHKSLNVRGAFLHMLGDLLTSVAVAVNGLLLLYFPFYWLDPLLSIGIAIFILQNCWTICRQAVRILMNATPIDLDLSQIKEAIERLPEVLNVHYLHVWNISSQETALSCHVVVDRDKLVSETELLSRKIAALLSTSFAIHHPVIQYETTPCGAGDILCELGQCGNSLLGGH